MTSIVHVTASITARGGGIPIALQALACAQIDGRISCVVIGHDDGGTPISDWPAGCARALSIWRFPGMPWAAGMADVVLRSAPTFLHSHGLWSQGSLIVPRASRRGTIPYMVSPHGMLDPWALENSRWKKRIASSLYEDRHLQGANCLHALCASEAESIRAYGLKNPIAIIPNGVELPEKLKAEKLKAEKLKAEKLKTEMKTLLFLGRIHPKKGLVNALRAWSKIRGQRAGDRSQEEWTFVIAGWDQGGHEQELKRLCDDLGLKYADVPAAEFVGESLASLEPRAPMATSRRAEAVTPYPSPDSRLPTSDLRPPSSQLSAISFPLSSSSSPASRLLTPVSRPLAPVLFTGPAFGDTKDALLRQAAAFILPSFSEGLPMSVLEAWAYQLPVLMTDHCNLPEGFAADAAIRIGTDVESIAEGMRLILRSPTSDLRSLGDNGRVLVEQRFTWPQVAGQMKEVYEWVLGGGEKPDCVRQF